MRSPRATRTREPRVRATWVLAAVSCAASGALAGASPASAAISFIKAWPATPGAGVGDGQLNVPRGVGSDASANIYVADGGNQRADKFNQDGVFKTKWNVANPGSNLFNPEGIASNEAGNVFVADTSNNRVVRYTAAGAYVSQFDGTGPGRLRFVAPRAIDVDEAGNVYVADAGNSLVRKFDLNGNERLSWVVDRPGGVATDSAGTVYVSITFNHQIAKFTPAGVAVPNGLWGTGGTGNGQFMRPRGLDVDAAGNVFVADTENNRVQQFNRLQQFVAKWPPIPPPSPGTGSLNGQFNDPRDVTIDCRGNVYVLDSGNARVQKFGEPAAPPAPCGVSGTATPQRQDFVASQGIFLALRCRPLCLATISGSLSGGLSAARVVKLKTVKRKLKSTGTTKVKIPLGKGLRSRVDKGARRGKRIQAVLKVRTVDAAGFKDTERLTITMKRRR